MSDLDLLALLFLSFLFFRLSFFVVVVAVAEPVFI